MPRCVTVRELLELQVFSSFSSRRDEIFRRLWHRGCYYLVGEPETKRLVEWRGEATQPITRILLCYFDYPGVLAEGRGRQLPG